MTPLLSVRDIRKSFPGVKALDGVSLRLDPGEILAVVGENGAGKSTLMKIVAGVYTPDEGAFAIDGKPVAFAGVGDAMKLGIVLIHQELNLAENLSVAANIFLGRELVRVGSLGWLDDAAMTARSRDLLARVGLDVSPRALVGTLPPGQRQLVEIARALSLDARLIIMDEPTSSLTQKETDRLYKVIEDLRKQNVAILYISHRLAEVKRVADRVTVLRDGRNAGELARDEISHESLVRLMVGRDLRQFYPRRHAISEGTRTRLAVRDLTFAGGRDPVSFEVRAGEIVGMSGLVGAGRTELAEALFGLRAITGGVVRLDEAEVKTSGPPSSIAAGLLLVPEDRRKHGLVLSETIRDNLILPNLASLSILGWIVRSRVGRLCADLMSRLKVRASGPGQIVGQLSGGNQQKIVLGKWLARQPRVLILDEPTRGVDVGARSEIYGLMDQLAGQGVAILMISSDMEEVLGMSDRIIVLHEGRVAGELTRAQFNEEAVMKLATGG